MPEKNEQNEWQFDVSGWLVEDAEQYMTARASIDIKTLRQVVAKNATKYPASIKEMTADGLSKLPIKEWQKALRVLSSAVLDTFQLDE